MRAPVLCSTGNQQPQHSGPDISVLNKTLQQQWDVAANAHMGKIVISKFSKKKVWWQCHQCPDGHLHCWQATVGSRSKGSGCPQCEGRKLCKHNSLATVSPIVASFWDISRNGCTADSVLAYSHKMSHWQCPTCGHEWTAMPHKKVAIGTKCPVCSHQSRDRQKHPTFTQCQHPLLAEWDHQQNAAKGLFPCKVTLQSAKKVHWLCSKCPLGQPHAWAATAANRTAKIPAGCPFCAGKAACKCNSLQTHCPTIAAEWDWDKNELTPHDFTASSHSVVWWRTVEKGSWEQTINSRTNSPRFVAAYKQYVQDNLAD